VVLTQIHTGDATWQPLLEQLICKLAILKHNSTIQVHSYLIAHDNFINSSMLIHSDLYIVQSLHYTLSYELGEAKIEAGNQRHG
jgi:hypothetical protein